MKILLINETWGMSGGQERYILQVGNGLLERNHMVGLFYGSQEGEVVDTSLAKFETSLISNLYLPSVAKYADNFNPDVICLQNVYDSRLINFLRAKYPVTRFVHDHTTYCPGNSKYFFNSGQICPIPTSSACFLNAYKQKCMTRRPWLAAVRILQRQNWLKTLKTLPLILCNSSYVKDRLVQNGLREERVVVNGLFPGHYQSNREEILIGLDLKESNPLEKTLLFVGRLFKEKGVDLLIKAVSELNRPVKVQIVGDGWEKENLIKLARDLGISHKVNFLGFKNSQEIGNLFSQCDLFVMPSVWPEGFGMVGLEAGQFRKPVVAFNVGGIHDWLTDGVNGLLIPRPEVNLLTEAIRRLVDNSKLSQQLGNNGFDRVRTQFNLGRHLDVLEESFLKIIK